MGATKLGERMTDVQSWLPSAQGSSSVSTSGGNRFTDPTASDISFTGEWRGGFSASSNLPDHHPFCPNPASCCGDWGGAGLR